jgi:hypothetical protein
VQPEPDDKFMKMTAA